MWSAKRVVKLSISHQQWHHFLENNVTKEMAFVVNSKTVLKQLYLKHFSFEKGQNKEIHAIFINTFAVFHIIDNWIW